MNVRECHEFRGSEEWPPSRSRKDRDTWNRTVRGTGTMGNREASERPEADVRAICVLFAS